MNFYQLTFKLSNSITPLNQILPYGKILCLRTHLVFAHLLIYTHIKFSPHVLTFFHFMRVNLSCNKLFKLLSLLLFQRVNRDGTFKCLNQMKYEGIKILSNYFMKTYLLLVVKLLNLIERKNIFGIKYYRLLLKKFLRK